MKTIKSITAAVLALAFAIPAQADEYIDRVFHGTIVPSLSQNGFRIQDTQTTPLLAEGESHTFVITPRAGTEVTLVAIGDWDSNDVDMVVRGAESGRLVGRDVEEDDMPVCGFTAQGGSYEVTITVHDTDAPAFVKLTYATR